MKIRLEFKWQDMWSGMFYKREEKEIDLIDSVSGTRDFRVETIRHVWIFILPMFPIHIWWIR